MSLIGKIQTLFSDKDKTKPVFPRTKINAVSDDNGVGLDEILNELLSSMELGVYIYTHITGGSLTGGGGTTGKFKAVENLEEVSEFNINNKTYIINSDPLTINKDSWYMFTLDDSNNTIHFLSSSGISGGGLNDYIITYNTSGGTLPLDAIISFGQMTPSFMLPIPTRTGYTFEGWYTNADLSGDQVTQVIQGTKNDLEFYAKWSANAYTYNIIYKSSSGVQLGTGNTTYDYNTINTINPKAFTGYTSPANQSIKWDSVNAKTITFIYTPITYTITYNLNSGTQGSGAITNYNIETTTFNLPAPTRNGYRFDGWFTTSNFSGTKVTNITKGTTGNQTYYAKWTQTHIYSVSKGITKTDWTKYKLNDALSVFGSSYIKVTSAGYSYGAITDPIGRDVTSFTSLKIKITSADIDGTWGAYFGIVAANNADTAFTRSVSVTGANTYTINLSDLSGTYYIKIRSGDRGGSSESDHSYITFTELWFE